MHRTVAAIAVTLVATAAAPARAENNFMNFLVGPVIGFRISGPSSDDHAVLGVEGGIGWGPERINLGIDHRAGRSLYYIEFDPWLIVGGSFGLGVDSAGEQHGIIGLWEGVPLGGEFLKHHVGCPSRFLSALTLAGGVRYTGVLEIYLTLKAGVSEDFERPVVCD